MIILDGKHVDPYATNITPERHRYIGMWRPPILPRIDLPYPELTTDHIQLAQNCAAHAEHIKAWLAGHFDEPQYESLRPVTWNGPDVRAMPPFGGWKAGQRAAPETRHDQFIWCHNCAACGKGMDRQSETHPIYQCVTIDCPLKSVRYRWDRA